MVHLENILKISLQDVLKLSWRRLEDVLKTPWRRLEDVLKTSWRHLEDVLKTYSQDEYIGLDQDVFKTSWRRLYQDECLLGLSHIRAYFFGLIPYYEVTLTKKYNKPLLQKNETEVFKQKKFIKNLSKVNKQKNSGALRLN